MFRLFEGVLNVKQISLAIYHSHVRSLHIRALNWAECVRSLKKAKIRLQLFSVGEVLGCEKNCVDGKRRDRFWAWTAQLIKRTNVKAVAPLPVFTLVALHTLTRWKFGRFPCQKKYTDVFCIQLWYSPAPHTKCCPYVFQFVLLRPLAKFCNAVFPVFTHSRLRISHRIFRVLFLFLSV